MSMFEKINKVVDEKYLDGDYIAICDYHVKEITKEEYEDECPWDKEEQ